MKKLILLLFALATVTVRGATCYVADVATGDGSGSSTANRKSFTALNAGGLSPGDFVSIGGTNSGRPCPGCQGWNGTAGNPITFLWETNAVITNAFDNEVYCGGGCNYLTFDMGFNGKMILTANGTGLAYQTNRPGFYFDNGSHDITLKNIRLINYYVHTLTNDTATDIAGSGAIYANPVGSNFVVSNGVISDVGWVFNLACQGTNHVISGITMSNFDHGIAISGSSSYSGWTITNCDFGATSNWDTAANQYHHDGIHIFSGGTIMNVVIAGNKFHGNWGGNNTAHIFMENGVDPATCQVFNNVFLQDAGNYLGDGFVAGGGHWFNNTFVGANVPGSTAFNSGGRDLWFINNVIQGVGSFVSLTSGGGIFSNNIYALPSVTGNNPFGIASTGVGSFNSWKGAMGEAGSTFVNVRVVNADGTLVSNSAAHGKGANLSAIFTTDFAGANRPASGAWDAGAYEVATIGNNPNGGTNGIPQIPDLHVVK
jgi:hypothetical protein